MSSTSSSSTQLPRTPLHERSDSENNKLQIRMVPYSPPRPLDEGDSSRLSHADEQVEEEEDDDDDVQSTTDSATVATPRTPKATIHRRQGHGADSSRSPSFSTPISPLAGIMGSEVSGSKLASGSSGVEYTAPQTPVINRPSYGSNIRRSNPQSQPSPSRHDDGPSRPRRGTVSRRENYISVHSDKTFSIVLKSTNPNSRRSDRSGSIVKSLPLSNVSTNVSTISSHEESSFDASTEDHHGSPLSSVLERSISPNTSGSPSTITALPEELVQPSPWNYRMVGGLRKVPITPDPKGKGKQRELSESPLPPLPVTTTPSPEPSSPLVTKQSFNSEQSASTIEETTNYKVVGRSSPPLPDTASIEVPSSSSSANYKLLGQSSPARTLASTVGPAIADTPGSKNYIVYDASSLSSSSTPFRGHRYHRSDDSSQRKVRERYSQESLLVPPLRPHKRSSSESIGYNKQQSGENLRGRASSFSSLSSIVSQDTGSLFTGSTPNVVLLHHTPSASSIPQPTRAESSSTAQQRAHMDTHQWSSQLSTVISEYEGSDPGSRGASAGSMANRVSSLLGSRDSRHIRSISSSLVLDNLETRLSHSRSHSQSDSLDRPGAVYSRGRELPISSARMIRDHDEHGDGLADLQHLQHRSSRTRLGFSRQASDRSLRSSASSRAGSLVASSFPSWARLYYSSPDRRWLAPLSRSPSEVSDSARSPWVGSGSPSHNQYAQPIYNPRRRPRDVSDPRSYQSEDSMEIAPVSEAGGVQRAPKKKSSSLWSPHLRQDTRASNFSMWNTPSITWSADSGMFGKRNLQVALFVMGFLFPFAWMIAAFLPLPPKPTLAMEESAYSTTQFSTSNHVEPPQGRIILNDDARYQSARWWRNINRFLAVAGLIIVGAVIALVVVGVREKWGRS
ncbi:hypothetical protein F4813DRAFT_296888 [Daldinia decipiens]|uniref:uncharacterized protein n=1 Tax=Daldinia decipiens TaxID=326647 RepID=UPI0020C582D3|nr:uncharacterized protein F4813DRAFT_296888 [Daldinia decipiens]KAI1660520.1 hypothetical protein F4813DRAFT_296888 [Daldinia decipiens]